MFPILACGNTHHVEGYTATFQIMSVKATNLQRMKGNLPATGTQEERVTWRQSSTTRKGCYQETTTRSGITLSACKMTGKTKEISAGLPETKASSYNRANKINNE